MTLFETIRIVLFIIDREADCRCGNLAISENDIQALKLLISLVENKE